MRYRAQVVRGSAISLGKQIQVSVLSRGGPNRRPCTGVDRTGVPGKNTGQRKGWTDQASLRMSYRLSIKQNISNPQVLSVAVLSPRGQRLGQGYPAYLPGSISTKKSNYSQGEQIQTLNWNSDAQPQRAYQGGYKLSISLGIKGATSTTRKRSLSN